VKIQRAATPGWGIRSSLYVHGDEEGILSRLLATHPPMAERIERLVDRENESRANHPNRRSQRR
jgi:heat shock protein HtpX